MYTASAITLPNLETGSKVLYKSQGGLLEEASIVAIHFDDALEPYYTIRIIKDGREKQTDAARIVSFSKECRIGSSSGVREDRRTHTKPNNSSPVQEKRYCNHAYSQVDSCRSNNQPSGSDHLDDQHSNKTETVDISSASDKTRTKMTTRQQALFKSILRPSSYGPIPRTELTHHSDKRDEEDGFDKMSAHSNFLGEVTKLKSGIFDRLRSSMSIFQRKNKKIGRMIGTEICTDDPHSKDDIDETFHEIEEPKSFESFGMDCCSQTASSESIQSSSERVGDERSQNAQNRFVFNESASLPLSSFAFFNVQEAVSDEIIDKTIQNLRQLSKRSHVDGENESCEQPPNKRARNNSKYTSNIAFDRSGTRARNRKKPCLYQPQIDKRYFERYKHKKKVRVNSLNPLNSPSYPLQDQATDTSSHVDGSDGLFGSDYYDIFPTISFKSQSNLYTETAAKARLLRRARLKRQSQVPEKKMVELRPAPCQRNAGQAETKNVTFPLIFEQGQKSKRLNDIVTQTDTFRCSEPIKSSPSKEETTIGSAPTHHTVNEAQAKNANTPLVLETEQETKTFEEKFAQTAGESGPEAVESGPSNEKKPFGELRDNIARKQILRNLLHTESRRKESSSPDFTFKDMPTPSKTSCAANYSKATGMKADKNCSKRPQRYKPMVTFAPERISHRSHSYLLRANASSMLSHQEDLSTTKSDSIVGGLPFDFMPKGDKCESNALTNHTSQSVMISLMKTYVIDLIVRLWRFCMKSMSIHSTISTQSVGVEENAERNSKSVTPRRSSRLILPKNFDRHPNNYPSKHTLAASKPRNLDTIRKSNDKPGYVKNPKGLLPPAPSGWDTMFVPKPGEWQCRSCSFKNPMAALTCGCCAAVKLEGSWTTTNNQTDEMDSPDEWRCPSCNSKNPSCAMTCDTCTAVKVDRTVLTEDDVGALTDNETHSESQESRLVKRSGPSASPFDQCGDSKRSKILDAIHHQPERMKDIKEGNSSKKHVIELVDDSNTKRFSLQHYEHGAASRQEENDKEDLMDIEMISDSPNNPNDIMSE